MTITTEQPLVKIEGLHKYYGTHHVLRGIDLTVNQGEVSVVIGPSGSGWRPSVPGAFRWAAT